MANDDYFVILFKLLTKLYSLLKQGKVMTQAGLDELGSNFNKEYWKYILLNAAKEGYITGIIPVKTLNLDSYKVAEAKITPKGIAYLNDNSSMQKVKDLLANAPGWASLILELWPK
ncbi:YjcQ family protein [Lactobacillus sp.]|uniref:YjcQ family protein n=1 Tax=Lactobacillus sp. TaxID=1591 RepID=UPI003EF1B90D